MSVTYPYFIATKKKGHLPLNAIRFQQFCDGKKKVIEVSSSCWLTFVNAKGVEDYKKRHLEMLEDWINIDIPRQAKSWDKKEVKAFLSNSQDIYEDLKKAINNLRAREITSASDMAWR